MLNRSLRCCALAAILVTLFVTPFTATAGQAPASALPGSARQAPAAQPAFAPGDALPDPADPLATKSPGAFGGLRALWASFDRAYDSRVGAASADICAHMLDDLFARRRRVLFEKVDRAHDHARRAEAALQPVALAEGLLHRVQLAVG